MIAMFSTVLVSALAAASSRSGTACGVIAATAGWYIIEIIELSPANTMASSTGPFSATMTVSTVMSIAQTRSRLTISLTRSNRSANTPPYAPNSSDGTNRPMVAAPIHAGE